MNIPRTFEYDIFLSVSSNDIRIAKKIQLELQTYNLNVFLSEFSIKDQMTKSWFNNIEESLEKSQHLALLVTRNSYDTSSIWIRKEYKAFLTSYYDENSRIIIPIIDTDLNIRDIPLFIRKSPSVKLNNSDKISRIVEIVKNFSIPSSIKESGINQSKDDTVHVSNPEHIDPYSTEEKVSGLIEDKLKKINREFGTFMDPRDGQVYKTITFDNQIWLAENLDFKSEKSRFYKDDRGLNRVFGRLYTWDDAINSCPEGWRIPDYYDWDRLVSQLGGYELAGEFLIHSDAKTQKSSDYGEDKNYGISLLYGGICLDEKTFGYIRRQAYFWSANESNVDEAWGYSCYRHHNEIKRSTYDKGYFLSCRCIMDKESMK